MLLVFLLLRLGACVSEADPSAEAAAEALPDPSAEALADAEARNSLLTDRALLSPFNPLASPFGPLSPNGVTAAHAAANLPHGVPHPPHHPGHDPAHLAHGLLHPAHPLPHPLPHHHPLPRGGLHLHVPLGACSLVCSTSTSL